MHKGIFPPYGQSWVFTQRCMAEGGNTEQFYFECYCNFYFIQRKPSLVNFRFVPSLSSPMITLLLSFITVG